jgi:tRNA A37 N6-isopentenylltransferase MiaA
MVNLITGPRGSGKTQQMIDLANEKVKTCRIY